MTHSLSMVPHLRSGLLLGMRRLLVVALLERSVNASSSHNTAVALQTIPEEVVWPLVSRVDVLVHLRGVARIELWLRLLSAIDVDVLLLALLAALHLLESHRLLGRLDELRVVRDVGLTVVLRELRLIGSCALC